MTRIFGRITWFGEFLMHEGTEGLVTPCPMYLSDDPADPLHPWYSAERDSVRFAVEQEGYTAAACVRGSLPLSFGLAGSTALAVLHLANTTATLRFQLVRELDQRTHGFVPSGVDMESITRQSTGLFSAAGWRDVLWTPPSFELIGFEKEATRDLQSIRWLLHAKRRRLDRLARHLSSVLQDERLFMLAMLDYCAELYDLDVYSGPVRAFIGRMLERGVAAKGIGGLYDKAVLVLTPAGDSKSNSSVDVPDALWTWPVI